MSGPLLAGFSIPFNVKNIMGSYSTAQKAAKGRDRALALAGMMTEVGNPLDKLIAYRKQSQIAPAFQEAQIEKLAGDNYRQNEFMSKMLSKQEERAKTVEKATTTSRDISTGLEMRTSQRLQPGDFQSQYMQGFITGRGQELSDLLEQGREARRTRPPAVFGEDWRSVTGVPRDVSALEAGSYVMERGNDPMLRGEQARFGEGLNFDEIYRQGMESGSLMTELFEQQAPPELGTLELAGGGGARARRRARQGQVADQPQEIGYEATFGSMYGGGVYGGRPTSEIMMERGLQRVMEKYGNVLENAELAFTEFLERNPISGDYESFERYIDQLNNPARVVQGSSVQGSRGFEGGGGVRSYRN